jgi:hypothetical protein|nr:hypothetical protein [Methanoculleus marisnigri]
MEDAAGERRRFLLDSCRQSRAFECDRNVTITFRVMFDLSEIDIPPLKADLRFFLQELLHQPDCRILVRDTSDRRVWERVLQKKP